MRRSVCLEILCAYIPVVTCKRMQVTWNRCKKIDSSGYQLRDSNCVRWRQFSGYLYSYVITLMFSTASVHNFQVIVQEDQRGKGFRFFPSVCHRQPMASDVFVAGNRLEKNFDRSEDAVRQRCPAIV